MLLLSAFQTKQKTEHSADASAQPSGPIRQRVEALNASILAGDILSAFEEHYAEDVVMQEVGGEPRVGKDACRTYEEQFVEGIKAFRGAEVKSIAVDEAAGVSFVEWYMDFDHEAWGDGVEPRQVAAQRWSNGQIVEETFYHG